MTAIVEFHKAQCFFSIPIMVASLFSGIFQQNSLNVFTLLPLTLNSVAPLQLILLLITHFAHFSHFLIFLTAISWALASIVYWTLYRQLLHISILIYENTQTSSFRDQVLLELARNPICGGGSALSSCPPSTGDPSTIDGGMKRAKNVLIYTPWIWAWYTVCMIGIVTKHWAKSGALRISLLENSTLPGSRPHKLLPITKYLTGKQFFWIVSVGCVALVGVQLYCLSIAYALSLGNTRDWSFGQIIAVTVWIPPIVEYLQLQISELRLYLSDGKSSYLKI